jgi:Fic family protein
LRRYALEQYFHVENSYPPLVRLAFIHYQFEAIHPFADGNGRIGRLLISLFLVHWELLAHPLLYLCAFFERHRDRYYELLLAVSTEGAWRDWVLFFLEGVAVQARDAVAKAKRVQDLEGVWRSQLLAQHASATVLQLVERLFDSPVVTVRWAEELLGVSNRGARLAVQKLADAGILQPINEAGAYRQVFIAADVLRATEDEPGQH